MRHLAVGDMATRLDDLEPFMLLYCGARYRALMASSMLVGEEPTISIFW